MTNQAFKTAAKFSSPDTREKSPYAQRNWSEQWLIEQILQAVGSESDISHGIELCEDACQYPPYWTYYGTLEFEKIVPIKFGDKGEIIVGSQSDAILYHEDWTNYYGRRVKGNIKVAPSEKYDVVLFLGKEQKFYCKPNSGGGHYVRGYIVSPTLPRGYSEYPIVYIN